MTTLNIETIVQMIKTATDKETIETLTLKTMEYLNNRLTNGVQISEKTFINNKSAFIQEIKKIDVSEDLKTEYKGYLNHHAITIAYQFKYYKNAV